ncbi:uncharacterized protein BJ212DRAFT_1449215 [Suillus subaureus]|uniref:SGNH hydrolase-type esterase domain-containing protein n=1 Tax=Suillus subaureus TaxID=48587 RepID=A0A9P7E0W0_9AGAM|nr:uncharacterized protein BJ212DRAFT_1449215 [Suillus subaureus]KAG1807853.1 hypothetical protein BJ212DRAFT_1449215 [Suillus subaureus]
MYEKYRLWQAEEWMFPSPRAITTIIELKLETALFLLCIQVQSQFAEAGGIVLSYDDPLIDHNDRTGSSFKINVQDFSNLTLNLGPYMFNPVFLVCFNATQGVNVIPFGDPFSTLDAVVRVNSIGWQDNHVSIESIELNIASLLPYEQSHIAFQCIGNSLSAGQYLLLGVNQAWSSDVTQISRKRTDPLHNYTTPWNFKPDYPAVTYVVCIIGANDSGNNITASAFYQVLTLTLYLHKLTGNIRITTYPVQPLFFILPPLSPTVQGHQKVAECFESSLEAWVMVTEGR